MYNLFSFVLSFVNVSLYIFKLKSVIIIFKKLDLKPKLAELLEATVYETDMDSNF